MVHPRVYLDTPAGEQWLTRKSEGYDFCLIDSFKAACPATKENDSESEARRPLDLMARVSEQTGCTFVVLHHANKPVADGKGGRATRYSLRGSGALYDGCQSIFVFNGEKGEAITVSHEKARVTGVLQPDFELTVDDFGVDGDPRGGLRVLATDLDDPERVLRVEANEQKKREAAEKAVEAKVRELFRKVPNQVSANGVYDQLGGTKAMVVRAVRRMISRGEIIETGSTKDRKLTLEGFEPNGL